MSLKGPDSHGEGSSLWRAAVLAVLASVAAGGCATTRARAQCDPLLASQGMCPEQRKPVVANRPKAAPVSQAAVAAEAIPASHPAPAATPVSAPVLQAEGDTPPVFSPAAPAEPASAEEPLFPPGATVTVAPEDPLWAQMAEAYLSQHSITIDSGYSRHDVLWFITWDLLVFERVDSKLGVLEKKYGQRPAFTPFKAAVLADIQARQTSLEAQVRRFSTPGVRLRVSTGDLNMAADTQATGIIFRFDHQFKLRDSRERVSDDFEF